MFNQKQVNKATKNVMKTINTKLVLYVLVFLSVVSVAGQLFAENYSYVGSFVALAVVTCYFTRSMSAILLVSLVVVNLLVSGNYLREGMKGSGMTLEELKTMLKKKQKELKEENSKDDKDEKKIKKLRDDIKKCKDKIKKHLKPSLKEKMTNEELDKVSNGLKDMVKVEETESEETESEESEGEEEVQVDDIEMEEEEMKKPKSSESFRPKKRLVHRGKPKYLKSKQDTDESVGESIDYASTLEQAYGNLQKMMGKGGMKGLTKETTKLVGQQQELMNSLKSMAPVLNDAQKTLKGFNLPDMGEIKKMMGSFNQKN